MLASRDVQRIQGRKVFFKFGVWGGGGWVSTSYPASNQNSKGGLGGPPARVLQHSWGGQNLASLHVHHGG